jgi:hypothetical protein
MSIAQPSKSAILCAFIWPTIIALVVTAVLMIERMQVDWTASCSLQTETPDACTDNLTYSLYAWLPAVFAFGLAHIIGAASFSEDSKTPASMFERASKFLAYFASHVFPAFGWYFAYVGLAAGFLISTPVVGLIIAFPVGIFAGGFAGGLLLALAAGPSFTSGADGFWKRRLCFYGTAVGCGALLLATGQAVFDPSSENIKGASQAGFATIGAMTSVALSCLFVSVAALKANTQSLRLWQQPDFKTGLAIIVGTAVALCVTVQIMASNGAIVFPREAGILKPIAEQFRGNKSPVTNTLELAGVRYIGPRSAIIEREVTVRDRMENTTLHKGTDQEVKVGQTVCGPYVQWRLRPPPEPERDSMYLIADGGGDPIGLHCKPVTGERQRCLRNLLQDGQLYIGFGVFESAAGKPIEIARATVEALARAGFNVTIPPNEDERILISGIDWKKRSPE